MATNDKGSDLDVFEGLAKKNSGALSTAPPPPPPPRGDGMNTLLGMTTPSTAMPLPPPANAVPSALPSSPGAARSAAPPPGREALPPIGPADSAETGPAKPGIHVDWNDDEDEATQIFDKAEDYAPARRGPAPAAGAPPVMSMKSTLLGMMPPPTGIFPPPGNRTSPPPPGPGSLPPPALGTLPPPSHTMQGLGSSLSRSIPPPPGALPISNSRIAIPGPGNTLPAARPGGGPSLLPRSMEATAMVRPEPGLFNRWGMVALVAVLAVGVGLFVVLTPRTGRIVINVTDTKGGPAGRVDIYVDGRKQCDTAPCIVDQQPSGTHEVKVLADGFEATPSQEVNVEPRKGDTAAAFVLGSAAKGTGIKVGGSQPGVKLYVDDKEIGPLPQDYRDMTPGDHVVKIAGSERYQPLERRVTVEKDKLEDLGTVMLKVLKGKVTITLSTPGARVFLASGTDRREIQTLPISVDIDTAKNWSLQATRPGFVDFVQAIGFDDGVAEKTYVVTLEPRGTAPAAGNTWMPAQTPQQAAAPAIAGLPAQRAAPPPAYAAPAAPAAAAAQPLVAHALSLPTQPAAAAAAAQPAAAGNEGFLNINSIPPSTVFLDGKQLGPTPKVHISAAVGPHQVKFVNAEQQLTKTISVTVVAGGTTPAIARLSE